MNNHDLGKAMIQTNNYDSKPTVDYAMILTSAVHDMKNSLCLVLQSIETMASELEKEQKNNKHSATLADLHYEVLRLNSSLIQVLSLYRDENDQLPLNITECFIADYFQELLVKNQIYSKNHQIETLIEIDPELVWYCDHNLVSYLITDIYINALRYSQGKIKVTASIADNKLTLVIADNGQGYSDSMLKAQSQSMAELGNKQGRTGLGLYFARLIASAHNNKNVRGSIKLANGGELGGGVFTLILP